jgi:hypothetical protein
MYQNLRLPDYFVNIVTNRVATDALLEDLPHVP